MSSKKPTSAKPTPLDWAQYRERKKENLAAEKQKQIDAADRRAEKEERRRKIGDGESPSSTLTRSQKRNKRKRESKKRMGDGENSVVKADKPAESPVGKVEIEMDVVDKEAFVLPLRPPVRPYTCPAKLGLTWNADEKSLTRSTGGSQ